MWLLMFRQSKEGSVGYVKTATILWIVTMFSPLIESIRSRMKRRSDQGIFMLTIEADLKLNVHGSSTRR